MTCESPLPPFCRTGAFPAVLALALLLFATAPGAALAGDLHLTVYAGQVTENKWEEYFSNSADYVDAYILVGALAWTFGEYRDGGTTLELEGQVGKYFGDQEHLEFNLPVAVRFHRFPWDGTVDTSVALGIGPSWASEIPEAELLFHDSTRRFLVYWFLEISAGPPGKGWAGVFRLHHRSKAYGLVAEDGGSNTLCLGVRWGG